MNKKEMLACLDNIQQQIDALRASLTGQEISSSGSGRANLEEHHTGNGETDFKNSENKSQQKEEDSVLSREEQFRERIATLLYLAASQKSEEEVFEGLRNIIHSETSSNDLLNQKSV